MDRHDRRLETNLSAEDAVAQWCREHKVRFWIKNEGHHWIFKRDLEMVEWWPSSAKFVKNKQWDRGVHVYDYKQALQQLTKMGWDQPLPVVRREPMALPTPKPAVASPAPLPVAVKPSLFRRLWVGLLGLFGRRAATLDGKASPR